MEVTPLSTTATQPVQSESNSAASLDYDTFLQLFISELKNQDPLDPTDASEYTAQLAQFSSVEQAIQTNQKLDSLLSSMSLSQADSMIGRTVTSADGTVSGVVESVNITSSGAVAQLKDGTRVELGPGITIS